MESSFAISYKKKKLFCYSLYFPKYLWQRYTMWGSQQEYTKCISNVITALGWEDIMHVKHLLCHFMHRPLFSPFHWPNLTFTWYIITSHAVKQLITTISPQLFFSFRLYLYNCINAYIYVRYYSFSFSKSQCIMIINQSKACENKKRKRKYVCIIFKRFLKMKVEHLFLTNM